MSTIERVLVLKSNTNSVVKIIKPGKQIQYRLKDDPAVYHGYIQQLQNDSFVVNNNAVFLSKLKMVELIPFFMKTKVYDLEKDWSVSIGNSQRSRFSLRRNKPDCCD